MKVVQTVAWSCFALDVLIVFALFASSRSSGQDAAGRGMSEAFSILGSIVLAVLGAALFLSTRYAWKPGIVIALVLAVSPLLMLMIPMARAASSSVRQMFRVNREGRFASRTLTEIAAAVSAGDTARIRALAAGAKLDFEARDDFGTDRGVTILGHAVRRFVDHEGSLEPVKVLLELGAPQNQDALRSYQSLVFTLMTDGGERAGP